MLSNALYCKYKTLLISFSHIFIIREEDVASEKLANPGTTVAAFSWWADPLEILPYLHHDALGVPT
ncbi:hypothetical protein WN943_000593 [Citrus x changshan-huyou]